MAISKTKYLALFLGEFRENLLSAENQIILLKNDRLNEDALSTLLRTLHNMKGSARMLQFGNIESLVHGTETIFKGVRDGRYPVDGRVVRFFFVVADRLRFAADSIERGEGDAMPDRELLVQACERLGANEAFDLTAIPALPASGGDEGREGAEGAEGLAMPLGRRRRNRRKGRTKGARSVSTPRSEWIPRRSTAPSAS